MLSSSEPRVRTAHSPGQLLQRDADSDDYKQGYQDGLSGAVPQPGPRDGDGLTDYNEGYAKGHFEFSQQTSSAAAPTPAPTPTAPSPSETPSGSPAPAPTPAATGGEPPATAPTPGTTPPTVSDDYKQGYQDGLNDGDSAPGPRDGDALTDYNEGYAKGHYEFTQQPAPGAGAEAQAAGTEKESVYHATRDVLRDFLVGTTLGNLVSGRDQPGHVYGPDHPWTVELQGHPHMAQVQSNVNSVLTQYCKEKGSQQTQPQKLPQLAGRDDFNLNTLSFGKNAVWLFNDAVNWLSWGALGQKSGYLFGSFRLAWYAPSPTCNNGLGSAHVKFYAWDVAHLGSAIRIPMTSRPLINIGDQPLGAGLPLNDVPIAWYWSTNYIFSY